jgi:glycosyltransferase involved in cell wall biosynthesis
MMEAASVTGPAKNLLGFSRWLQTPLGKQSGIELTLATFDRNSRAYEIDGFAAAAKAAGLETHIIRERHRFDLGVRTQVRELIARIQPHIIQTHNNKSHLIARSLPRSRRQRCWIAFQHGRVYSDLKQRLYNEMDRLTLRSADRVISVCQAFSTHLVAYGVARHRIRVLHNSATAGAELSLSERTTLRLELGADERDFLVLSIGRLSVEKGHSDLLRALSQLTDKECPWKLGIVGAGPELETLNSLAESLGIRARVVFTGFRRDADRMVSAAELFVLPSHSEGSSNVLLEAMLARTPVIATNAGGNPEIVVSEKTGLIVPVANPPALAKAIDWIWKNPARASEFARNALERATHEFSVDRYREALVDIYYESVRGARAATAEF